MGRYFIILLGIALGILTSCKQVVNVDNLQSSPLDSFNLRGYSFTVLVKNVILHVNAGDDGSVVNYDINGDFNFNGFLDSTSSLNKNIQQVVSLNYNGKDSSRYEMSASFTGLPYLLFTNDSLYVFLKGIGLSKNILTLEDAYDYTWVSGSPGQGHQEHHEHDVITYRNCTDSTVIEVKLQK